MTVDSRTTTWHQRLRLIILIVATAWLIQLTTADRAQAQVAEACPSTASDVQISHWIEMYRFRGVTLCAGVLPPSQVPIAWVQIVDFQSGAKMRVMSEVTPGSTPGLPGTLFNQKTASQWFNWVQALDPQVTQPHPALLFSVTNSAYFSSGEYPGSITTLSFPEKKWNQVLSTGADPGGYQRRVFGLGPPTGGTQQAWVKAYPTPIPHSQVPGSLSGYFDATVALHPQAYPGGQGEVARRTYLGTRRFDGSWDPDATQNRAYIMTTTVGMTRDRARDILVNDFNTQWNVQLDGGNSTSFESIVQNGFQISGSCPFLCRRVPEVLVIYLAP